MNHKMFNVGVRLLVVVLGVLANLTTAQEDLKHELATPGPYRVGVTTMIFEDARREDNINDGYRKLVTEIWYPAINPDEEGIGGALRDAEKDASGAPYPLIVYSHHWGGHRRLFMLYLINLASHGFVVVSTDHNDTLSSTDYGYIVDRPMDVLYVIDQVVGWAESNLVGMIDAANIGVTGYSQGALTALELTGAQIDPAYLLAWCKNYESISSSDDICIVASSWDEITAYRTRFDPPLDTSNDALWPSYSDERIRAVLPLSTCWRPIFGEQGLAAATVPTLMIVAADDHNCPYERDAVQVYRGLGAKERYLITLIHGGHGFINDNLDMAYHFSVAFFGYYLQGREEYADYLTENYVNQFDEGWHELAWGVYEGN